MKLCTKMRVLASHADESGCIVIDRSELIDISLVPDDHDFGYSHDRIPDDGIIHIEGGRAWRDSAASSPICPTHGQMSRVQILFRGVIGAKGWTCWGFDGEGCGYNVSDDEWSAAAAASSGKR